MLAGKRKNKIFKAFLLVVILYCSFFSVFRFNIPTVKAGVKTLYMWNVAVTRNSVSGYELNETDDTSGYSSVYLSTAGDVTVSCYMDVFILHEDGSTTQLADDVASVSRASAGSGMQSATWYCSGATIQGGDVLEVKVILKVGTLTTSKTF